MTEPEPQQPSPGTRQAALYNRYASLEDFHHVVGASESLERVQFPSAGGDIQADNLLCFLRSDYMSKGRPSYRCIGFQGRFVSCVCTVRLVLGMPIYPSLVLNTVALLVSAFLSWRLIKVFPIQVFFFVAQADLSFAVIRLADFQAHRGFFEHQPHLQAHSDAFYRHPVVTVLRRRVDRYLARPNLQWYFCPPIN